MTLPRLLHGPFLVSTVLLATLSACDGGGDTTTEGAGAAGASSNNGGNGGSGASDGGMGGLFDNTGGVDTSSGSTTSTATSSGSTSTTAPPDPNGLCKAANATDGSTVWAKKAGGASTQSGLGVATDTQGNVFVSGSFKGTIAWGGNTFTAAGLNDAYVAKLGPDGAHIWSKQYGNTDSNAQHPQVARRVATDPDGNVLVWGYFRGTMTFGGTALNDIYNFADDVFLAKLDPNGNHIWSQRYGDQNNEEAQALAVDGQGNVLVAGAFQRTIDFGGGKLDSDWDTFSAFVAKLDPSGNQLWAKRFGDTPDGQDFPNPDPYEQKALDVTADKDGNVYLVGYHQGSIDFGGGAVVAAGLNKDPYVAKFSPTGAFLWAKSYSTPEGSAIDVAVDPGGNVFVLGQFKGKINFGDKELDSGTALNTFLLKFDSAGTLLWWKRYGSPSERVEGSAIALDTDKPVLLGAFFTQVDFGGGQLTSKGNYDVFVAKLDEDGCVTHSKAYGGPELQGGQALSIDPTGNIVFAGSFDNTVDFGTGDISADGTDAYVVKTKP